MTEPQWNSIAPVEEIDAVRTDTVTFSYPSEIRCAVTNVNFTGRAKAGGERIPRGKPQWNNMAAVE